MGSSALAMKLPPRDPYEPQDHGPPADASLPAPTAIFLSGPPSPEADRLAGAILGSPPGALFIASDEWPAPGTRPPCGVVRACRGHEALRWRPRGRIRSP